MTALLSEELALIRGLVPEGLPAPKDLLAPMILEGDQEALAMVRDKDPEVCAAIEKALAEIHAGGPHEESAEYRLAVWHRRRAAQIVRSAIKAPASSAIWGEKLDRVLLHPVWGGIFLLGVLYFGFYQFVGNFGAGTVVDLLEEGIFLRYLNPLFERAAAAWIPWAALRDLFTGEYGLLTLGLRYAVSLILPIVTFFFFMFAIIEDTGYLPRLAMLLDGWCKRIGLSGRAVIPMVLGLGCVTMATLVTRTLPTRRERVIATVLLSLAVPCSAQLGVILGLLSAHPKALILWLGILLAVFFVVGGVLSRTLPGGAPSFYMELPLLRVPSLSNIFLKTWVRLKWYFYEVLPLFLWASAAIWVGRLTGVFDILTRALALPLGWIGLPPQTAPAFLFGFFRRDYGAAGLYDLDRKGGLTSAQVLIACVAITLFLPCIAQFLVTLKERGWKAGIGIAVFTLAFSFAASWAVYRALVFWGVTG